MTFKRQLRLSLEPWRKAHALTRKALAIKFRYCPFTVAATLLTMSSLLQSQSVPAGQGNVNPVSAKAADYFPPPESRGGWRKLEDPQEIRRLGGMDPDKLKELKEWLLASDDRPFGGVVIRNGYIV